MNDRATALAPGACYGPSLLGDNLPLVPSSEGFTLVRDEIESIIAVANGYIVTRTLPKQRSRLSQPVTFAAGIYADDPASKLGPALLPDRPSGPRRSRR
jgi:hypothetical protein